MKPLDYPDRIRYRRPPKWYRRGQRPGVLLTSLGLAPSDEVTLEVQGRNSGKLRRTPVIRFEHEDHNCVLGLAGESDWVSNVRPAHGMAAIRRRGARRVRLVELPIED